LVFGDYHDGSILRARRGETIPDGAVTVRFSGTSTLLFSDGETRWMVDRWFSRPGPLRLLLGKIGPDLQAIDCGLAANDVLELDAVLPVHSHYDHAMDAPAVAGRTGALLLGSPLISEPLVPPVSVFDYRLGKALCAACVSPERHVVDCV
jgi:L-ascorbate metabolism protein UlaG (beta-lactamase superfamily)